MIDKLFRTTIGLGLDQIIAEVRCGMTSVIIQTTFSVNQAADRKQKQFLTDSYLRSIDLSSEYKTGLNR